jgi:hypothetical protein
MAPGSGTADDRRGGVPSGEPNADTPPRFYDLLRLLCGDQVEFVLIGGFAVTLQGYVRTTQDIDIVPKPSTDNLSRLWDALSSIDARPGEIADFKPEELPVPFSREGLVEGKGNWTLYTGLGRIDLMSYVEDMDGELTYDELRAGAERIDLVEVGHPIWVASVEHLIGMKQRANRDQDRIDITALRMAHGLEE